MRPCKSAKAVRDRASDERHVDRGRSHGAAPARAQWAQQFGLLGRVFPERRMRGKRERRHDGADLGC